MTSETKPVRMADFSRSERCEECGHKIGYAEFTARLVDGVWVLRHNLAGYENRSCKEAY